MPRPIILFILFISLVGAHRHKKFNPDDAKPAIPIKEDDANWKLVFLQALSPVYHIPLDPNNASEWKLGGGGYGQLTPDGMAQHYNLGVKLRNHYAPSKFFSDRYVSNELISALSNMMGFFSQNADPVEDYPSFLPGWPSGYVPIPIHTVAESEDPVLGVHECPYEKYVYEKLLETPEVKQTYSDHKDLFNTLSRLTRTNITLNDMISIYDTLHIEKLKHEHMPPGFNEGIFYKVKKVAGIADDFKYGINVDPMDNIDFSMELPRMNGGPLLQTIVDHLNQKRQCLDNKDNRPEEDEKLCRFLDPLKYYVFSAHDTTISSLFSTFGFKESNFNTTDDLPHYASCVTIELLQSKDGKDYKVEVLYWPGAKDPWMITKMITGCEDNCTLDQFTSRSQPYKIHDMDKYCNNFERKDHAKHKQIKTNKTNKKPVETSQSFSVPLVDFL